MAPKTPYADLYKWDKTDTKLVTIQGVADNSEKIDTKLKSHNDSITAVEGRVTTIEGKVATVDKRVDDVNTDITTKVKPDIANVKNQLDSIILASGTSDAETVQARGTFPILKDRLNSVDTQLAEITTDPIFEASDNTKSAALGSELVDGTGWTVPTGWTGDSTNGFVHTPGTINPLTKTLPTTGIKFYQVSFRVESPTPAGVPNASTDFTVTLGNSTSFVTYQGGGTYNYTFGIQSVSDGNLVFTPGTTFDGTIKNISVKEIVGTVSPSLKMNNNLGNSVLEMRTTEDYLFNKFIGKDSGKLNTTGRENVALGDLSLIKNTTGYWNTAIGKEALEYNTVGSRNVAIGFLALNANISGDRNIAIGSFTLDRNTTGRQNIALGADCMWVNTTGSRNIAMGMGTMGSNTTGDENVAIGHTAMDLNVSGKQNVAIGFNTLLKNTDQNNSIAIGSQALKNSNASNLIAIGTNALSNNTTGLSNVGIGYNSLFGNQVGTENIALGHMAGYGNGSVGDISQNTLIGAWAGNVLTAGGNNNTLIGYSAGKNLTTGNNNIIIGRNVNAASATASGDVNIGNIFRSNIFTSRATIGTNITNPAATLHLPASSASAQSAPLKFNSGAVMTSPEVGAFEFDGTNLYFTINGNVRKTIQLV